MSTHLQKLRRTTSRAIRRKGAVTSPRSAQRQREAVANALGNPIHTKLTLGAPDDAHEREADAVAEKVMRMPTGAVATTTADEGIQRKCTSCEQEEEQVRRSLSSPDEEEKKDEEQIKRKAEGEGGANAIAGDTAARIQSNRGGGEALPTGERAFFESRFGRSFEDVRVHADSESADLASAVSARAFTVGGDVFFGAGEYRPGTPYGRHLLAHELTHVTQQRGGAGNVLRRWDVGAAPAPHGWSEVADADHLQRLDQAEDIVRGVLGARNCRNYFTDNCTNGGGATALRTTFDNAQVYLRPVDDNIFGQGEFGGTNIAFNLRAFRIGRYMMASTLLHEMFHNCDPAGLGTGRAAELDAENALETCRMHMPWIDTVSPRSAAAGTQVTITGWGFGPTQGASDEVLIGGVSAPIVSWSFMADSSSKMEIIAEVPAGAVSGGVVVINNRVRSNAAGFTVT